MLNSSYCDNRLILQDNNTCLNMILSINSSTCREETSKAVAVKLVSVLNRLMGRFIAY